jgi:hypothetical protein
VHVVAAAAAAAVVCAHSVKKAVLRLVEVFVEKCADDNLLVTQFVPALMEPVLGDYAASVPDARWGWMGGLGCSPCCVCMDGLALCCFCEDLHTA